MDKIEYLEDYKESLKAEIERAKRLELLLSNKEFKEFIAEGYMKDYALDNLQHSTNTSIPLAQREEYSLKAKSTCILSQYIAEIINKAHMAQNQLNEIDEEING